MNKNARVEIRMTQAERSRLQRLADENGMNVSQLLRSFINNGTVAPRPTTDFHEFSVELRRIGNNLNQIAALAHSKGFIDVVRLNSLLDGLWELERQAGNMFGRTG